MGHTEIVKGVSNTRELQCMFFDKVLGTAPGTRSFLIFHEFCFNFSTTRFSEVVSYFRTEARSIFGKSNTSRRIYTLVVTENVIKITKYQSQRLCNSANVSNSMHSSFITYLEHSTRAS